MRENWSKDSFVAELAARFGIKGALFTLAMVLAAYLVATFMGATTLRATIWCAVLVALIIAYEANEVAHDMPAHGFRPFRSRRHTIIWRICQHGLTATFIAIGVCLGANTFALWHGIQGWFGAFMLLTWLDLFSYWWNDRKPQSASNVENEPSIGKVN